MLALLHRDVRVARRELLYFFVRVALQPLLFVFIFGYVMPRQGIIEHDYTNLLLPGILALSMTLSGMQSVAMPLVIDFGYTKEIEDRLLAPIGIHGVALEKIIVGVLQAFIAGLFVLPLTWLMMQKGLNLDLSNTWLLLAVSVLASWSFAAFGLVLGSSVDPQQIGLMFNVILAPMIFFGCAYYPWAALSVLPWLQVLVMMNPLVYASEGFRASLTPQVPHMPLWLVFLGLVGFSCLFTWVGLRKFHGRAVD